MKKPKLDYGDGFNETNSICVLWHIDDVKELKDTFGHRTEELTDAECLEILKRVEKKYDPNEGITWETICLEYDYYLEESGKWGEKWREQ